MKTLLKVLFSIGFGILNTLAAGFVLSKQWVWFITPKFTGMPALSYLDAVGVMMVFNFLLMGLSMSLSDLAKKDKDVDELTSGLVKSVVMIFLGYPLILLGSYVWHQFI